MFGASKRLKARIEELEAERDVLLNKTFFCRPQRPIIVWLLANVTGDQWLWYWRVLGEGYYWSHGMAYWSSRQFKTVDERYSDDIAIALWKTEKAKEERKVSKK